MSNIKKRVAVCISMSKRDVALSRLAAEHDGAKIRSLAGEERQGWQEAVAIVEGGRGERESERRSLDLIFRMKDSSSRAFTRSTRAFQRLPEYEQETARDDNAEELCVSRIVFRLLDAREGRKRGGRLTNSRATCGYLGKLNRH